MARVRVDFDNLRRQVSGTELLDEGFARTLGRAVVREVKRDISVGKSPVARVRRFEGYKVDRISAADRAAARTGDRAARARVRRARIENRFYPNSVRNKFPQKRARPVNLELSGDYLDKLTHRRIAGSSIAVGFFAASRRTLDLFEAHNLGRHEHVPQRKHLPTVRGDNWTRRINLLIKSLVIARIRRIIRSGR